MPAQIGDCLSLSPELLQNDCIIELSLGYVIDGSKMKHLKIIRIKSNRFSRRIKKYIEFKSINYYK